MFLLVVAGFLALAECLFGMVDELINMWENYTIRKIWEDYND